MFYSKERKVVCVNGKPMYVANIITIPVMSLHNIQSMTLTQKSAYRKI